MADRGDRLARADELTDEVDRWRGEPQLVGVEGPAGQYERVELVDVGLGDWPVHGKGACRFQVVVARLDLARLHRQQFHPSACVFYGGAGLFELDLLDSVRGQEGDFAALQFIGHGAPFLRPSRTTRMTGLKPRLDDGTTAAAARPRSPTRRRTPPGRVPPVGRT